MSPNLYSNFPNLPTGSVIGSNLPTGSVIGLLGCCADVLFSACSLGVESYV